ncbi:IS5 family transposase [Streptomyces sp. NPDC056503]|uniref:IS5 family transposase n=1 Tax=Streptomyces sp. NPDC056503 TaxID=3345842 RepID=UPI00369D2993
MIRHELSDAEWDLVEPLLPRPSTGRPRLDDRTVLNGIVWKFRTGVAWRDVPQRYGSVVRAHQHAAGARKRLRNQALGRSRGGLTSKLHLAVDGLGRPLALVLTGGNTNDCTRFTAVMDAIRVPRSGPGRPRIRPDHVLGDKGYGSQAIRAWLRLRGIGHTIPERADQIANRLRRGSLGGRPVAFGRQLCKCRNVVEHCFNRLKQWRGLATRYDKTAASYHAAVTLASLLMWACPFDDTS